MTNKAAGPFTAGKCQVHDDTPGVYDGAAVFEANGEPFCFVSDDIAIGGNPGARARATRIAESLNKTEGHDESAVFIQPRTPAEFRDLMNRIMRQHEASTCSPEATALGSLFLTCWDLAHIATPGDPNGIYRAEFFRLNPELHVQNAEAVNHAFTAKPGPCE